MRILMLWSRLALNCCGQDLGTCKMILGKSHQSQTLRFEVPIAPDEGTVAESLFAINERTGFQFRAEAYDFINHANLSTPNLHPTSSQFGMITSKTGLARQLQLSLRFYF